MTAAVGAGLSSKLAMFSTNWLKNSLSSSSMAKSFGLGSSSSVDPSSLDTTKYLLKLPFVASFLAVIGTPDPSPFLRIFCAEHALGPTKTAAAIIAAKRAGLLDADCRLIVVVVIVIVVVVVVVDCFCSLVV